MAALSLYIRTSGLKVGEKLPPERELAVMLNTSRPTLRKILDRFEKIGVIERNRKGGTTIVENLDPVLGEKAPRSNVVSFITIGQDLKLQDLRQTFIQEQLLKKGYILNTYFASHDMQDLEKEQHYLRSLFRINPKGLVVTASPNGETNEFLFDELERSNIRVVHMDYYKKTLPRESFILPDWRGAGIMAASYLHSQGCQNMILGQPGGHPPSIQNLQDGMEAAAKMFGMRILDDALVGRKDYGVSGQSAAFLAKLPPKTGVVTMPIKAGIEISRGMTEPYGKSSLKMPLIAVGEHIMQKDKHPAFPVLNFSWEYRAVAAMNCILAPETAPQTRELILPEFVAP